MSRMTSSESEYCSDDLGAEESSSTPPPMKVCPTSFFSSPVISGGSKKIKVQVDSANEELLSSLKHSDSSTIELLSDGRTRVSSPVLFVKRKRESDCTKINNVNTTITPNITFASSEDDEEEPIKTVDPIAIASVTKKRLCIGKADNVLNRDQTQSEIEIRRSDNTPCKKVLLHNIHPLRQYFHARTNQPILTGRELLDDDDDDCEDDWHHTMSEKLIDSFDDVSQKEKNFMKLWNRHIKCHHVIADRDIPQKVESFIASHRDKLKEGELRNQTLLHLLNLLDFGLISSNFLTVCMIMYDDGVMPCSVDNNDWVRLHVCDVCKAKAFETIEEAIEHERECVNAGKSF